jgi:RNA methyltransferase, TrmH family
MSENKWKGGKPSAASPWKTRAPQRNQPVEHEVPVADAVEALPRPIRPSGELRLYGRNACLAAFAKRPQDLRKVYLIDARLDELRPVLAWCAKHKLGYRIVETSDLDKLTGSRHHEGVCFEMRRHPPLALDDLLAGLDDAPAPALLIWLDGVGNPHNLGALLRSAAHFAAAGVIVPSSSTLDLSGAAARVAEGGAEAVKLARVDDEAKAVSALRLAGFTIAATVPNDGEDLYTTVLARRTVLVFGAEGEGMTKALIEAADQRLSIPGSGLVDSLNISASAAVVLGEYWRQQSGRADTKA